MDTKLKNNNTNATGYGLFFVIELFLITATAITACVAAALINMGWMSGVEGHYGIEGTITNHTEFNRLETMTGIGAIVGIILGLAILVLLGIMVGKKRDENSQIHLNWFDRVWLELQLAVGALSITAFAPVLERIYYFLISKPFLDIWTVENVEDYAYDETYVTDQLEMAFYVAVIVVATFAFLMCYTSIIKKIKAHQLWEKSLLGGAFLAVYRAIKSSNKTTLKVLTVLMIGAFISATWLGLPFVLVLILIFVPTMVRKFDAIKKGVEEVKSGNLTYKIPVEADAKGVKGEFDRLASDINDISQASSIAVQNELKNQRMKTDLISNVSHDLKTPLTSMISYIDLMKKEGLESPNAPEYLDIIDNKTQRLRILTENLFEAAKASSGAIPVNMSSIDLASLLTQSLAEMEEKLEARKLEIRLNNTCQDAHVWADGQLTWRVLENLLGNISKYAMEDSRVYMDIKKLEAKAPENKDMVILEIKNVSKDALNIPAEELMERFKRGDESRNTEGSGLGLAIAKDLVKLMKGVFEISIDGDLFKVTVMLEAAAGEKQEKPKPEPKAETARTAMKPETAVKKAKEVTEAKGVAEAKAKAPSSAKEPEPKTSKAPKASPEPKVSKASKAPSK